MENSSPDNKYLMPPGEVLVPEVSLGRFVAAYRDKRGNPIVSMIVSMVVWIICLIIGLTTTSAAIRGMFGSLALLGVIVPIFFIVKTVHFLRDRDFVFLYEQGFLWEIRNHNGETISSEKVSYADVVSMREKSQILHGRGTDSIDHNLGTRLTLILSGHDGHVLFTKTVDSGSDHNVVIVALQVIQKELNRRGIHTIRSLR